MKSFNRMNEDEKKIAVVRNILKRRIPIKAKIALIRAVLGN